MREERQKLNVTTANGCIRFDEECGMGTASNHSLRGGSVFYISFRSDSLDLVAMWNSLSVGFMSFGWRYPYIR